MADLARLGARLYNSGAVEEAAVVDRQAEAIRALAKSGAPPPRSFNAAMLAGHELLREHTGASVGYLGESGNGVGAQLVCALPGAGGLPTGSSGKAMLMLSGGIDSPVAGYMIAKRGVVLDAVHFFSFPYTGELAKEKVLTLARAELKV
mgnify:CR=1 FL=1